MGQPNHPTQAGRPCLLVTLVAAVAIALPSIGHAQVEIIPVGEFQFEHSSNESQALDDTFRTDLLRINAGFESVYMFSSQELFLDASYGTVTYDNFVPDFGDDEYALRAGLQWLVGHYLDGLLEAVDEQQVPSVYDSLIEGNAIQAERRLTANVNVQLAQRWRLETTAISRSLDTPIVEIDDFGLRETIYRGALRYLSSSRLSFGAEYEHTDGNFRNAPELATYTQETPAGFLQYEVTDIHTVRVKVGWTEREQADDPEPYEEVTGNASIHRVLTGKTSVNAQYNRSIDNYFGPDAGAFALVDSWNAGVNWSVTGKSTVYADYGQTRTEFLGDGVGGQVVTGRIDRSSTINLSLENKTLHWLTSELYIRLDDVDSNIDRFTYDGVLVGIKLEARLLDRERP